jgi:hypothetical protein
VHPKHVLEKMRRSKSIGALEYTHGTSNITLGVSNGERERCKDTCA